MKKHFLTLAFFLLFPSLVFAEYKVTQQDIARAEKTRAMAVNMGLDKITPGQWLEVGTGFAKGAHITDKQKKALACIVQKAKEMQFESPIEVYARFISDKEFEEQTDKEIEASCGLTKLLTKQK